MPALEDIFQETALGSDGTATGYLWSNAANWTEGVPADGAQVTVDVSNTDVYDDIGNLQLDGLTITGEMDVTGSLTVGEVTFVNPRGVGAVPAIFSDTLPGNRTAVLNVDALNNLGDLGANGAGAVTNVLATSDPGRTYVAINGGKVVLSAAPAAGSKFLYGTGGVFAFEALTGTSTVSSLLDVAAGDAIALPGSDVSSVNFGASSLTIVTNLGTTTFDNVTYFGTMPTGYTTGTDPVTGLEEVVLTDGEACFARGTRIAAVRGEVAVEDLAVGDSLRTLHWGMKRIKWIGSRTYIAPFCNTQKVLPICIKAGAIAENIPARDLFVSPGHALCIDGALIHAARLVNGVSITQAAAVESISYYHIETDTHEVIFAEKCPAETFRDEAFRGQFHNAAEFDAFYPDITESQTPCLPLLEQGFALDAIQRRLALRAGIAEATASGALRGYVDVAGPEICAGWAQDLAAPDAPVCLDIFSAGKRIARVLANFYREDLHSAGIGNGQHGFEVTLPQGTALPLEIRRTSDGAALALTEEAGARAA